MESCGESLKLCCISKTLLLFNPSSSISQNLFTRFKKNINAQVLRFLFEGSLGVNNLGSAVHASVTREFVLLIPFISYEKLKNLDSRVDHPFRRGNMIYTTVRINMEDEVKNHAPTCILVYISARINNVCPFARFVGQGMLSVIHSHPLTKGPSRFL